MNTNQNGLTLKPISDRASSHDSLATEVISIAAKYEVKIRPLPPEIDRLVKKYLSRY